MACRVYQSELPWPSPPYLLTEVERQSITNSDYVDERSLFDPISIQRYVPMEVERCKSYVVNYEVHECFHVVQTYTDSYLQTSEYWKVLTSKVTRVQEIHLCFVLGSISIKMLKLDYLWRTKTARIPDVIPFGLIEIEERNIEAEAKRLVEISLGDVYIEV